MRRRAERMYQAAREAGVRASALSAAAAVSRLDAQRMSGNNQRTLAAARAGRRKNSDASS
ncbi:hypothetical protein [Streptomyces sp. Ac-502]|uniref:hypothetical protein n=1 Tax=Streptomyces sp. Ac-502 TaxID=3342801 RepID=UPI0038625314